MIVFIMGRSHRPQAPRRRSSWEPVPLRLPLDRPGREQRPPAHKDRPSEGELDHGSDPADDAEEIGGNHVIVIDLA